MSPIKISYYSDVLCIWAYVSQHRLDKLIATFSDEVEIEPYFCSVFPDAWTKIQQNWKDRGGFDGFNAHTNEVAKKFPDIEIHDRLWIDARPRTSASAHLFVKAIELIETEHQAEGATPLPYQDRTSTRALRDLRTAFFAHANDISDPQVHARVSKSIGIDYALVEQKIHGPLALTRLAADYDHCRKNGIDVSPTFVMNDGRQKLIGNVGYRLLEANIQELLRHPQPDQASWC